MKSNTKQVKQSLKRHEFHSHTFLSDGELHPMEHIRRAHFANHATIALTDHCGATDADAVVPRLAKECAVAMKEWDILAVPGVELTHLPPNKIAAAARAARRAGAQVVVVHGETVSEPVVPGTNLAAAGCPDVDILAHPGLLSADVAQLARETGVFLELSAKPAHAYANGIVARGIEATDAPFLINGDVHSPEQFVTVERARVVGLAAGLPATLVERSLTIYTQTMVKRLR